MRRASKTDANQKEIVDGLRRLGCTVQLLHVVGHGCPDILVGYLGANYLMEIKTEQGKLTPDEFDWRAAWHGQVHIVRTLLQAAAVVGIDLLADVSLEKHAPSSQQDGCTKRVHLPKGHS